MNKNIQKQVDQLRQQSNQQLSQFKQAKETLKTNNASLHETVNDIDGKISELKREKDRALLTISDNEGAIKGIDRLLNGGK
ncbi:hypothetical protein CHL76_02390 [Marinococcus halophilus]|uniref:Uncharacterized protein n=1 Tax=Marinococcus halophilus TaxID=1371 RepID=A0A510Y1V3_MARHA|nr:hypothetical protein [Marinococcus halophilus]OZT81224.1 hypothetical protein CHL76_02390 [Marinococcus halophilus]GEK57163.1 hypothetical protein MHA01_00680 [Marinococcus halophilus]